MGFGKLNALPPNLLPNKYMYFKKQSNDMYIRTPFNSVNDLVQYFRADSSLPSLPYNNPLASCYYAYLLAKSTAYTNAASWAGTIIHSQNDDITPLYYNGTYIGGNHGAYACQKLTVASHDKTDADLGSVWQDAGAKTWYLVQVIDATHLLIISDFGTDGTTGRWTYSTTLGASPLTHVSGATHTANIAFTANALEKFMPSIKNVILEILLDGMIVPDENTVYQCSFLDIVQTYDICDPRTTLAYMKANIGKTIIQAVADSSVTKDVAVTYRYRYFPNGSCVIYHEITSVNHLRQLQFNGVQSGPLEYSTGKLLQYIPRVSPFVGSVKTWDFKTPQEIQGTFETITLSNTTWENSEKPPFRFTQIAKDSSNNALYGFTLGFSLAKLDTIDATRKSATPAYQISSSRKQYPYGIGMVNTDGGITHKLIGYRGYFDPNNVNGATVYQYHQEGNELIVDIDFHVNVDHVCMPIPAGWNGKTVTTLHSDGGITVHTSTVDGNGIMVSVTGSYGSATIKIA